MSFKMKGKQLLTDIVKSIGIWLIGELRKLRKKHPYATITHTAKSRLFINYRAIGEGLSRYAQELMQRTNNGEIVGYFSHPKREEPIEKE